MYKRMLLSLTIGFLLVAWSSDPRVNTTVCDAGGSQTRPAAAGVGSGGTIIAWEDYRDGQSDIYAQRIDVVGQAVWAANGIEVCGAAGFQRNVQVVADGRGGVIVVWEDGRNGEDNYDIYAQRIDRAGNKIWGQEALVLCDAAGDQGGVQVVALGHSGAVICWADMRNHGNHRDIYVQRVDDAGNLLWPTGGVAVAQGTADQHMPRLTRSAGNGVVIAWSEGDYNDHREVYAQRLDGSANLLWGSGGVKLGAAASEQMALDVTTTSSGDFILGWIQWDNHYISGVRVQRLNDSGTNLWRAGGIEIFSDWDFRTGLQVESDGKNGAILLWTNSYPGWGQSYETWGANRIDGSGKTLWGDSVWCDSGYESFKPAVATDGKGGAFIAWEDPREGEYTHIYGQYYNAAGQARGPKGGFTVAARDKFQRGPQLVAGDDGGVVATWYSAYDGDIFAQKICKRGSIGDCVAPRAVIQDFRFGGIAPATIEFDGSGSNDPLGRINRWKWDLGDGTTASQAKVPHTYDRPGTYRVSLQVRGENRRWSDEAKALVKIFALNNLEVELTLTPGIVKAGGRGLVKLTALCREKSNGVNGEERPIPVDLGMDFTGSSGSWRNGADFVSGIYTRTLVSGEPGTATVKAVLSGKVMAQTTVQFAWPLAPIDLKVDLKVDRGLFSGVYRAHLTWAANPDEVFVPVAYRIYRSLQEGAMQLVGEVDAATFTFTDERLAPGNYGYAVSMVDNQGDEGPLSTVVTPVDRSLSCR